MKKLIAVVFTLLSFLIVTAQTEKLPTATVDGKTVYVYKVNSGDGWYSIARKFNITYAELKMANKKTDKLKAGAKIFIPAKLKSSDPFYNKNHVDSGYKSSDKKSVIVVGPSQTLFSISKKYKVSVDELKRMNGLKSNAIKKGQHLIISEGDNSKDSPKTEDHPEQKPEVKPVSIAPVKESTPVETETPKPEIKTTEPKKVNDNTAEEKKFVFANGREEVNESGVASWIDDESSGSNKYYALHRTAPSGTIIKITNKMNQRSIYVKVVGKLQDTGDNDGLIIKVSKAGAEKLGVIDQKFQASLVYGIRSVK